MSDSSCSGRKTIFSTLWSKPPAPCVATLPPAVAAKSFFLIVGGGLSPPVAVFGTCGPAMQTTCEPTTQKIRPDAMATIDRSGPCHSFGMPVR